MTVLILDSYESANIVRLRKQSPAYRWDEVWDGVYVIPPIPDILHQELAALFIVAFYPAIGGKRDQHVHGHCNISDRNKAWMQNVRCPDAAVFLAGNPARNRRTHWQGGPDFLVEVVMPGDRCRDKLDFYAKIGTREVLIVDRDPWRLEMYRRRRGQLKIDHVHSPGSLEPIASKVLKFEFQLVRGRPRSKLKIIHTETGQEWIG